MAEFMTVRRLTAPAVALITGALLGAPVARADAPQDPLSGCWTQTSPVPFAETPPDKTWTSRTWCFRPRGELTTLEVSCRPGGGCDGHDHPVRYRWQPPYLWTSPVDVKGRTGLWTRCRVRLTSNDSMVLEGCDEPPDPWLRETSGRR